MGTKTPEAEKKGEVQVERFPHTGGTWSGLHAAQAWCREHGYAYGEMQRDSPIGVHRESECSGISKWRNLSQAERAALDGRIEPESGSFRDGPARLTLGDSVDDGIPPRMWGKDHWSTFAFVDSWCGNAGGTFEIWKKRHHMRTNPELHPELGSLHFGAPGVAFDNSGRDGFTRASPTLEEYPTRLRGGLTKKNHDDWSCLQDLERRGLVEIAGTGVHPEVTMTDRGLGVAAMLNAHKRDGGSLEDFAWHEEATA